MHAIALVIPLSLEPSVITRLTTALLATSSHLAAIHRHPEVAQLLIQQGASVNAVDAEGYTALFEAENGLWDENLPHLDSLRTQVLVEILRQAGGVDLGRVII